MRTRSAAILLATVACHATEPLPTPTVDGAASALFVGERDGALLFTSAYEIDDGGAVDITAPSSRPGDRWWMLSMGCPLETIGLQAGAVVLGDELPVSPVPPPFEVSALSPNTLGTWSTEEEPSPLVREALRRLPVPSTFACELVAPTFETEAHAFRLERQTVLYAPTFGARLDARTQFVTMLESEDFTFTATSGHSAYYLDFTTDEATLVLPDLPQVLAGHVDDAGEMWLLTPYAILRGTPTNGFTTTATLGAIAPVRRGHITGRGAGDTIELSITTSEYDGLALEVVRRWLRYEGGQLELLVTDDRDDVMPTSVVVGAGHIVAINLAVRPAPLLHEYRDGNVTTTPIPTGARFWELVDTPGVGLLGRNSADELYRYANGSFELFERNVPFITTSLTTDVGVMFVGARVRPSSGRPADPFRAHQVLDWPGGCRYEAVPPGASSVSYQRLDGGRTLLTFDTEFDPGRTRATLVTLVGGPEPCTQR